MNYLIQEIEKKDAEICRLKALSSAENLADDSLNKQQAARLLGVSVRTLQRIVAAKQLPVRYLRGRKGDEARFSRADIEQIRAGRVAGGEVLSNGVSLKSPIPYPLRWDVWRRDGFKCLACGSDKYLTADHVVPEIAGGETVLENLQTLCRRCNSQKAVTYADFRNQGVEN